VKVNARLDPVSGKRPERLGFTCLAGFRFCQQADFQSFLDHFTQGAVSLE
jgi:hypothetical protein